MTNQRQKFHPPPPSEPAERLLAAVESIAHNLEGLRHDLAATHKRSPGRALSQTERLRMAQVLGFADLARELLAPYFRRR